MIDVQALRSAFRSEYGTDGRVFYAPGRVNLIGEHTDYNDGFVLPMAIARGTAVAITPRADRRIRAFSTNVKERVEFDLDFPGKPRRGTWLDYLEGMAQQLLIRGFEVPGADVVISSDLPSGAGLSSSAALEMSFGLALCTLTGAPVDRRELALAGQAAEHQYVGTQCGIMDQFICAMAQEQHALLIDCRSLEAEAVPLRAKGLSMVIVDTQIKHDLATSEYNLRREECFRALEILRTRLPDAKALRDVSLDDFRRFAHLLPPTLKRRARHVVTENARTRKAAEALAQRDWTVLGQLMFASHQSLSQDYEVSCKELDHCVECVAGRRGVIGGRMTGAGFGGCTVNLVSDDEVEELAHVVSDSFQREFQSRPEIYVSRPEAGAREL
jgi:galactokinase